MQWRLLIVTSGLCGLAAGGGILLALNYTYRMSFIVNGSEVLSCEVPSIWNAQIGQGQPVSLRCSDGQTRTYELPQTTLAEAFSLWCTVAVTYLAVFLGIASFCAAWAATDSMAARFFGRVLAVSYLFLAICSSLYFLYHIFSCPDQAPRIDFAGLPAFKFDPRNPLGFPCIDNCLSRGDGICQDGGPGSASYACALGTDCTDCGARSNEQLAANISCSTAKLYHDQGLYATLGPSISNRTQAAQDT